MENQDVRWKQRFDNLKKAFFQLDKAVRQGDFNELERQGLIKSFEYTYELAWNPMRDFLIQKGNTDLMGSKDTIRLAFQVNLIQDGDGKGACVRLQSNFLNLVNLNIFLLLR